MKNLDFRDIATTSNIFKKDDMRRRIVDIVLQFSNIVIDVLKTRLTLYPKL